MSKKCPYCDKYINGKYAKCEVCDKEFITIRNGKYCSTKCKQAMYRWKKDAQWSPEEQLVMQKRIENPDFVPTRINRIKINCTQ